MGLSPLLSTRKESNSGSYHLTFTPHVVLKTRPYHFCFYKCVTVSGSMHTLYSACWLAIQMQTQVVIGWRGSLFCSFPIPQCINLTLHFLIAMSLLHALICQMLTFLMYWFHWSSPRLSLSSTPSFSFRRLLLQMAAVTSASFHSDKYIYGSWCI